MENLQNVGMESLTVGKWINGMINGLKKESEAKMPEQVVETKRCYTCGETLPATNEYFHNKTSGKDGLQDECISCRKEYQKKYRASKRTEASKKTKITSEPIEESKLIDSQVKIRINDIDLIALVKDGNSILPLTDLMKAIYGSKHQSELGLIRDEIDKFVIKVGKKFYVSLMALGTIMDRKQNKDLLDSITRQALCLPKIKKDPVEVLYDGIVSMSNVNNLIKQLSEDVNKCNMTQNDILHYLENNELTEKELAKTAYELQTLRHRRRDFKNRQTLLDEQITELKNMGFKGSSEAGRAVTNLAKLKAELEISKKHQIYFKRDGSNKEEMEQKIRQLTA